MSMYIVLHVHTISAYRFQRFQHYNILVTLDDALRFVAFHELWQSQSNRSVPGVGWAKSPAQ
jgi:hypothetical protein